VARKIKAIIRATLDDAIPQPTLPIPEDVRVGLVREWMQLLEDAEAAGGGCFWCCGGGDQRRESIEERMAVLVRENPGMSPWEMPDDVEDPEGANGDDG
jgi:hypothetical protein